LEKSENDNLNQYSNEEHFKHQRRKRRHKLHQNHPKNDKELLRAHFIYPVQTQHFRDDDTEGKNQKSREEFG
jgi:hypothetical protein